MDGRPLPVLLKQIVDLTRLPSAPSTPPSACAVSPEGTGPSGLRYRYHSECVSLSVTKLRSLDQNVKAKVPTDLKSETSEESETSESVSSETFKPIPNTSMYDALLGYICSTVEEQHAAFRELKSQDPPVRVVLKPTDGLGCAGLVLDATEADLAPVNTKAWIKGSEYTIEEMIGAKGGPSPTVYMCGTTPIAVADQIMCGTSNHGNFVPSAAPSAMQQAMAEAGVAIGRYLDLKGQWGLDFVIDEVTQDPVVVDLNMGRPNGNLAYFLWRSIQIPPPMVSSEDVHQTVAGRVGPEKETSRDYVKLLRDAGLLWLPGRTEGVVPSYYIAGQSSTIVCVSWTGREDLIALYKRLKVVDTKGTYKMDV